MRSMACLAFVSLFVWLPAQAQDRHGVDRQSIEVGDALLDVTNVADGPVTISGVTINNRDDCTIEIDVPIGRNCDAIKEHPNQQACLSLSLKRERLSIKRICANGLKFITVVTVPAAAPPPHSVILWESIIVDAAGVVYDGDAAFKRLHAVARETIFGYYEPNIGGGLVGGPYAGVLDISRATAAAAVRILSGEKPADLRITPIEFATPKLERREMQRWGISHSQLPLGSVIDFHDPTAWEQYRWQITTAAIVIVFQAGLITVLIYEHRRRRVAELQTRERMAELAHVNWYTTAGELSASIAHELNQPLTAIRCNVEAAELMLNSATPNLHEIKDILVDIRKDDERAGEVLRRLRGLLKKTSFAPQDIDLNKAVSEVFAFVSALAKVRNVTVSCVSAPQSLRVRADRIQLQQVILNLIMNGIDMLAAKPAGLRRITGRIRQKDESFAEVSISDSGPGIPSEQLGQVFEPFFTTKDHGMGVGLSIARRTVEAHGGRIWAENRIDGGAVFRVTLPLGVVVHADKVQNEEV